MVRTSGFHPDNSSSILLGDAKGLPIGSPFFMPAVLTFITGGYFLFLYVVIVFFYNKVTEFFPAYVDILLKFFYI